MYRRQVRKASAQRWPASGRLSGEVADARALTTVAPYRAELRGDLAKAVQRARHRSPLAAGVAFRRPFGEQHVRTRRVSDGAAGSGDQSASRQPPGSDQALSLSSTSQPPRCRRRVLAAQQRLVGHDEVDRNRFGDVGGSSGESGHRFDQRVAPLPGWRSCAPPCERASTAPMAAVRAHLATAPRRDGCAAISLLAV